MANNLKIPSNQLILQQMLSDYAAQTSANGFNISTDPGSEIALRYSGVANQLAVIYYLAYQQFQSQMIDSASGTDLDRLANQFGVFRRGATPAQGFAELVATGPQTLTTAMTLTASNGLLYQVAQTGVYQPNSNFPVIAVDTGSNTNLSVPSILTWGTGIPPLTATTAPVSVALTGGEDTEDDTTLRNRLLLVLQNPPQGANAGNLIQLSQNADTLIQAAFVYANYNGAGTQLIALVGYQTTSYIGRDLPHLATDNTLSLNLSNPIYNQYTLPNSVNPLSNPNHGEFNYGNTLSNDSSVIYGQLPVTVGNVYATAITTVNNLPANLALTLTLPYPVGAASNGVGGGWNNFTTFPNPDGYWIGGSSPQTGYHVPQITAITGNVNATSTTPAGYKITIAAATGSTASQSDGLVPQPTNGVTQINWINRSDALQTGFQVVQATVLYAKSNNDSTWTLILDTPLVFTNSGAQQTDDFNATTGTVSYSLSLTDLPVPGSVSVAINNSAVGSDDGAGHITGAISGSAFTGTVNYSTGAVTLSFGATSPTTGQVINFSYTIAETDFFGNTGAIVGDYIFPASANAQTYLTNVLQNFALLGPGQVTTSTGLLALGAARTPSSAAAYGMTITNQFNKTLTNNPEVYNSSIYYNQTLDTAYTFYNSTNPGQPPASAPPGIFMPYQIGFYDANNSK